MASLTWLDCKLLFLITQLSQSLFEAEAIGFHEGGEEKPEWPSQDFTKNRQLAIHLPSIHGPLSLLVHKRFYNDLQGFHKFTRIYKDFTKNRQLAIHPSMAWASLSSYKTRDSNNGDR